MQQREKGTRLESMQKQRKELCKNVFPKGRKQKGKKVRTRTRKKLGYKL